MTTKITVITVCLNAEKYIEQTITSVAQQTYGDVELILVDGGSSDGTIDIINKYKAVISKWVSEPDKGIADAMNKGVALSSGDYLLFLNADDFLYNEKALEACATMLTEKASIGAFNIYYLTSDGRYHLRKPRGFNWWNKYKMGVYHQGVFCHRDVFSLVGHFDTDYKLAFDYDFFLRAHAHNIPVKRFDYTVSVMRDTGISSRMDWASLKQRFFEERRVHEKNCTSRVMAASYSVFWLLYLNYRYIKHLLS